MFFRVCASRKSAVMPVTDFSASKPPKPVKVGCAAAGSESLCQLEFPELVVAVAAGPVWAIGVKPGAGQAGGRVVGSDGPERLAPTPAPTLLAALAAAAAAHGSAPAVDHQGSEGGTVPAYRGSAPAADQTSGGGTVPARYGCICSGTCCG